MKLAMQKPKTLLYKLFTISHDRKFIYDMLILSTHTSKTGKVQGMSHLAISRIAKIDNNYSQWKILGCQFWQFDGC